MGLFYINITTSENLMVKLLQFNKINKEIQEDFIKSIESLHITFCSTKHLEKIITLLIKFNLIEYVKELQISGQDLYFLSDNIGKLYNLEKLDLGYNKIINLPAPLKNLNKLHVLDLSNNKLQELPDIFNSLETITTLDLRDNGIHKLPDSCVNLKNLRCLKLNNNVICELPENFGNISKLSRLELSYNKLKTLPKSFGKLKNLFYLSLNNNNLLYLPYSFANLNLRKLDLSSNQLSTLPYIYYPYTVIKNKLSCLNKLKLNGNKLTVITKNLLPKLLPNANHMNKINKIHINMGINWEYELKEQFLLGFPSYKKLLNKMVINYYRVIQDARQNNIKLPVDISLIIASNMTFQSIIARSIQLYLFIQGTKIIPNHPNKILSYYWQSTFDKIISAHKFQLQKDCKQILTNNNCTPLCS